MPARRARDYRAEEERRNIRARAMGFTSRAQQRRYQEKGIFPSARERRTEEGQRRAREVQEMLRQQRARDEEARRWSAKHSRQRATRWSDRWSRARKDRFYSAFVQWWDVPNDERDFSEIYDYMIAYEDY